MTGLANHPLAAGADFYVIVGSAGAALIGIQFVVRLGGALLVSALLTAPWRSLVPPSAPLAACGLGGIGYGAVVVRRVRRQTVYAPVQEDWVWHAILPCGAYAALALGAAWLCVAARPAHPEPALARYCHRTGDKSTSDVMQPEA